MSSLIQTAHGQLMALWLSFVCWTLTAVSMGLIQWRVWHVDGGGVVSSGLAWVGLWRTCFNSHVLVTPEYVIMFCRDMSASEDFVPPEIKAAQVLVPLALVVGLFGNAAGVYALRNVYFGLDRRRPIRVAFSCAGFLCLAAAGLSLAPLLWNLHSVMTNQTIDFPPEFHMPPAPVSQQVGAGIVVGVAASVLMAVSAVIFLAYRFPVRPNLTCQSSQRELRTLDRLWTVRCEKLAVNLRVSMNSNGKDNPAYVNSENL